MIGLRVGLKTGVRTGGAIGIGADTVGNGYNPMAGVPKDSGSNKYTPETNSNWLSVRQAASVAAGSATSLWLSQDASGQILDSITTNHLTAFSTVTYQNAIAGWTRTAFGLSLSGSAFYNLSVANCTTGSALWFAYIALSSAPGADAPVMNLSGNGAQADCRRFISTSGRVAKVGGLGAQGSATGSLGLAGTVHPVWLLVNRATSTLAVVTDLEAVSTALTLPSNNTAYLAFEGIAGSRVLLSALWTGAAAEVSVANIQAMNTALGW